MGAAGDVIRRRVVEWDDPRPGLSSARALDGLAFLRRLIDGTLPPPPFAQLLGMQLLAADSGLAVFAVEPGEHHYNPMAAVHGGVLATLCDSAMGCAVLSTCGVGALFTTLELSVNYVRPVLADTGRITCEGRVVHRGGRIATAEGKVVDGAGKLYAHGTTTCMILEPKA
jgi:uncharacterized protein (TIGR00369 family)